MNSTRNFTNSSNTQNISSFKDKLKELTTGVALAGTLLMGTACGNQNSTTADQQKDKIENVEGIIWANEEELDSIQLASIEKDILEISLDEEEEEVKAEAERIATDRAKIEADKAKIEADRAKISARIKASFQRQAKDWDWVSVEVLHSSQKLQQAFLDYISECKKYWYDPNAHAQKLLASIKK